MPDHDRDRDRDRSRSTLAVAQTLRQLGSGNAVQVFSGLRDKQRASTCTAARTAALTLALPPTAYISRQTFCDGHLIYRQGLCVSAAERTVINSRVPCCDGAGTRC